MAYNLLQAFYFIKNQSMAATFTSNPVEVMNQDNVGIQLNWTGTPTGAFTFQVSNDYAQDSFGNVQNVGNWITLPVTPAIAAAGSGDVAFVDLNQTGALYVRVVYTRASGTGTLNGYISAKGV